MKDYRQIETGVFESVRSEPQRPIDETRIREIVKDKTGQFDRRISDTRREDRRPDVVGPRREH